MEFTIIPIETPITMNRRGPKATPEMEAIYTKIRSMQVGERFRAGPFESHEIANSRCKAIYRCARIAGIRVFVSVKDTFVEFERTQ